MKIAKTLLVVCGLIVLTAGAAAACTYECVGDFEGCRSCVDLGYFTGQTCIETGPCRCQYTLNTCSELVSGAGAQNDLAAVIAPAGQGAVCSAVGAGSGAAVQF